MIKDLKVLPFLLMIWTGLFTYGQENIGYLDSLQKVFGSKTKPDTAKINAMIHYGWKLSESNSDSAVIILEKASQKIINLSNSSKYAVKGKQYQERIKYLDALCTIIIGDIGSESPEMMISKVETALKTMQSLGEHSGTGQARIALCGLYRDIGEVDRALLMAKTAVKDFSKVDNKKGIGEGYGSIAYTYFLNGTTDSAQHYWEVSLKVAQEVGDKFLQGTMLNNLGHIHSRTGELDKAIEYFEKSLAVRREIGIKSDIAQSLNTLGSVFNDLGDIELAQTYYMEALVMYEEAGDDEGVAIEYNNLAYIHQDLGNLDLAEEYYEKSRLKFEKLNDGRTLSIILANLASVYEEKGLKQKQLEYIERSLEIAQKLDYKSMIASNYIHLGSIFWEEEASRPKALEFYQKALKINKEIGDKANISNSNLNLAESYYELKEFQKALKYGLAAHKINVEIGFPSDIANSALELSEIYEAIGNTKQSLEYIKVYISMNDSVHNADIISKTSQQQAKYEYNKKRTADLAESEKERALEKAEHDKQRQLLKAKHAREQERERIISYSVGAGLLLVVVFLFILFKRLQITKRQKAMIESQKEDLLVTHLELEEKNTEILDSINYAKRIQSAILPPDKLVKQYLPNSFILYKPKDIVAGDFYWMELSGDVILFAAADCTGHGVPGAMVSVVCNNGLNRSVREHGLTEPGKILDKTRDIVISEFGKSEEEVKDGMDIALCSLQGKTLKYAGAHNPLWIIRKGSTEVEEIKAHKQPIGKYGAPSPYPTHTTELSEGDHFYVFSDGYVDQFGGQKGKKFKAANFKRLLLSIQNEPIEKQKELIDGAFENWKGNLEQLDDVCIIGVKI